MDVVKIKRMIGHCKSLDELAEVINHANKCRGRLRKQNKEATLAGAWDRVKLWDRGALVVFSENAARVIYKARVEERRTTTETHTFKPGEIYKVYQIQPRAKRLWLTDGEYVYGITQPRLVGLPARMYTDELTARVAMESFK